MTAIEFKKVYFSYEQENQEVQNEDLFSSRAKFAIHGVDFQVREGEFVAILGHNGSGKSTLARLTNGLLKAQDGEISVFGLDASEEKNLYEIRKQVGIVFQNPDNQTVASIVEDDVAFGPENIGISREEIGERIQFALRAVGMEQYRHATPERLSGGQKQRIAIAGVLALKPRVMILDESTAMLDPKGRKEVMDVVLRLNREEGLTVVLITHFPEEALLADRAVIMSKGNIVAEGTPQEVFAREGELEKYSLVTPRAIRICRELSASGLSVSDSMEEERIAKDILSSAKMVKGEDIHVKRGAGMRSSIQIDENNEIGRVYCKDLTYVYNPTSPFETYALKGVDLEIKSGEFFGIIGHTGSGKSTFVQHLNGLLKVPTAEKKYKEKKWKKEKNQTKIHLLVNGFDLTDKKTDFRALRKGVGMVFQYPEYQLFAETVLEDVAFGLKNFCPEFTEEQTRTAVREAIEMVGLNFEEIKDRSPFELSGGQKRRVAIAGVIVTKPTILVLDEPAAGLDPLGKEEIMSLLHKIHREWCKTVIIVSHDMDEVAENCTRAAVFSEGSILAVGTPRTLFSNAELLRSKGLDVPFTAKVSLALEEKGLSIDNDFTIENFVEKTLEHIKTMGAGMSLLQKGGRENG